MDRDFLKEINRDHSKEERKKSKNLVKGKVERAEKGEGTSFVKVEGKSRYWRLDKVDKSRWTIERKRIIEAIHDYHRIPVDVLEDQYFRLNVIEADALCHLLGTKTRKYPRKSLLKKCEVVYLAQDKIKAPDLDMVRMFRHYDRKGAPIENSGIPAIVVNVKLYRYITLVYSRRK
jgi:hypothetical protein